MRIRRLELIGFKSFPFQTAIDFPEGITAIVGPNGCGKSNILDALMWVMGATSPKLLRSRSMEDVIFSGAEGVAPLGRAEVRLLIDNAEGLACEPYRELPEIEIRRVVYRTGESEFWLNKRRCRLRDIAEFFLGTGLGSNSYAIIEQGKVDSVINAKPEERRLLLDESAGISKYKERREISVRKMEATKQNLSRVEDVLYEVNRQANRLKRQAAKARRYQRLKARLDILKLQKAILQFQALQEKRAALADALQTRLTEIEAKEAAYEAAEARVAQARTQLLEREEELRALNETYARKRDILDKSQKSLFALQEQQGRLEEALKGLTETAEEMARRRGFLKEQAVSLERETETLKADLARQSEKLSGKTTALESVKKRLAEAEAAFESHRQKVFEAMTAEVDAKNRVAQLTDRIDEMRRGIASRKKELDEARGRFETSRAEESRLREAIAALEGDLNAGREEKKRLDAALEAAEANERDLREKLRETEKKLSEDTSSLASLKEIQRRMEDVSSKGARTLLGQFFRREEGGSACKLVADTIEVDPRYDRALEAILRDELEFVLVDDHDTALESLSFLKEKRAGRSGLIPRNSLSGCGSASERPHADAVPLLGCVEAPEEEKNVLSCLLKDVWVVETPDRAVEIQKRNGFSGVLVTLEGDVFYANGVIVGGSDEPGAGGRIARNRKIGELEKRIRVRQSVRETQAAMVEKANAESRSLKTRLAALTEEIRALEMDLVGRRRDLENARRERERIGKRLEILRMEIETLRQGLASAEAQREKAEKTYQENQARQASLKDETGEFEEKIQALRARVEERAQAVNRLRIEEAKTKEKLQGLFEKRPQLESEIVNLGNEISEKQNRSEEIVENLKEISGRISQLKEETRAAETELESLQEEITSRELALRRSKEEILKLDDEKSSCFKGLQALKEQVAEKQLQVSRVELEINALVQEVKTHHAVDLAAGEAPSSLPEAGEETEIPELEEQLRRMGEINFVAVQEFDELKERIAFLEQQRADLLEAIQTLTETIQRINRTTSTRFKETFEKIQGYFSDLFVKLFGGGRAELRLTDPHNYQETGVEIFAQPPGKRLQAIRLLSGGEKALVSIAFLFSLFLTRPSPFCVLDEVDAPLDEGNIDRFNALIGELSELSQFILITHNKRTMACAQSLLGVTMEQPGVSKIISVSLEELPS